MSKCVLTFLLLGLPLIGVAQQPHRPFNVPTLSVLLLNRPAHIAKDEWLEMMEKPVNRSLYPLYITQAMLDTLDGRQLDMRFQYVMVREMPAGPEQ